MILFLYFPIVVTQYVEDDGDSCSSCGGIGYNIVSGDCCGAIGGNSGISHCNCRSATYKSKNHANVLLVALLFNFPFFGGDGSGGNDTGGSDG